MRGAPPTCTAPKFVACLTCELSSRSRDSVVLVDHAAEYFAALHRCVERHDDRLVVVGWSLTAGLLRPVAVVVVGGPSQHPPQVLFVVDQHSVVDPLKAIINVQNYTYAVSQVAQTSLRSVIGQSDMDQLLSEREKVNARLKDVIDAPTEQPWGIRVERVEVKDVALPESMKRSMSRQAEAERERRARIISADGEYQASKKLAQAAAVMAADPAALQLRLLQTVVEVAAEKNSTLVMPVPVELLRFFDRAAPATTHPQPPAAQDTDAPLPVPEIPALTMPESLPAGAALTAPLNTAPKTPATV